MLKLRSTAFSIFLGSLLMGLSAPAIALDLDWHGQLRAETNWLWGYSNGNLKPDALDHGYAVFLNGDTPASFQNLFFDLSPRVIVNDNVSIKSDLWLGTPDTGMFGSDQGMTSYYYSTRTGNATVVANTFYAEMATDFGTITVGRAPLNWGLGLIWSYDKTRFYRMPSTGDVIKMTTKLGAFRFTPSVVKYRLGSNYGGSTGGAGTTIQGSSGVSDYSVALSYANEDDQMDLGVLFLRRLAGPNAVVTTPFISTGYAYNVWDFYARKNAGIFTFAAEVPLVTGSVGGQDYSTVAGAAKVDVKLSEKWKTKLNVGMANGQGNTATVNGTKLTAFYFHPDYRPGLLMFNYNLQNLSDGTKSPYDNPITNATFFSAAIDYSSGKWSHELLGLFASADKTADGVSALYFNSLTRNFQTNAAGASQEKGLGFELDYSLGYEWDEAMQLGLNFGLYFPGNFYKFANSASTTNNLSTIFGSSLNVRVSF